MLLLVVWAQLSLREGLRARPGGSRPALLAPGPVSPAAGLPCALLQLPWPRLPHARDTHLSCDNQNVSSDIAKRSQGDKVTPFENPWVEATVSCG